MTRAELQELEALLCPTGCALQLPLYQKGSIKFHARYTSLPDRPCTASPAVIAWVEKKLEAAAGKAISERWPSIESSLKKKGVGSLARIVIKATLADAKGFEP